MNTITPHYSIACQRGHLRASRLSLLIALALGSTGALAQEATTLDGVSVTGVRASIQKSLVDKRNAAGVVDAITAEDMGKFPDINLSESLQRIPGITLDRNNVGEGSAINLRGLGPEFTRVEINGMPGMSNGTESRTEGSGGGSAFNFEIFASELFSKATVYKTGMAEVDEGGLAGTVRLETPRPLDTQGTRFTGSLLGNYSDLSGDTDPRAAVLFSHNHDDVFGVAASVAWSSARFVSYSVESGSWKPFADANTGTRASDEIRAALTPVGTHRYLFDEDRDTTGATLTLQFRPNDALHFTLDGMHGKLKNDRVALRDDMPIEGGANAPSNVVIENGVITAGEFTGIQQRVGARWHTTDEKYQQVSARLELTPNEYWSVRPMLGYARREVDRTWDLYSFRLADDDGNFDPGTVSYRVRGDYVDIASTATDYMSNPENFLFNVVIMRPARDMNSEKQARLDVDRHFANNDHVLKFGLRHSESKTERAERQIWLNRQAGVAATDLPTLADVYQHHKFKVSGAGPGVPPQLLGVNKRKAANTYMPGGTAMPGTEFNELTGYGAQQTYQIQEKTLSGWIQMDLSFDQWTVIPGVRHVRTEQISSGFDVVNANQPDERIDPLRIAKIYNGWLPSLTTRYDLSEQVVLRAAYARTLTRPNPGSLAPSETVIGIDESGGSGSRGNPNLEPYYANNFDLGAEWYFSAEGMLAANVFYKKISNFIDNRSFIEDRIYPRQADNVLVTGPIAFSEPVNGVSATIKGVEVSVQSRFAKLPGAWGNFGGILNYSHTESSSDFGEEGDVRNQGLPGLSKNSLNAVLYYDDGTLDARLTYSWRDRYLAEFAGAAEWGIPRFTDDYGQLDFSLNYRINPHVSLQAQILNLTKEQQINYSTARYLPYGVNELDRRIMLGVRVAF